MANFSTYYPKLLIYEGGYMSAAYTKILGDNGGETYCGIARNYNKTWPGWAIIDAYKAQNGEINPTDKIEDPELSAMVEAFSKATYWDTLKLDDLHNQSLAEQIMDFGFNSGLTTAAIAVQRIVGLPQSGFFSDEDIATINKANTGFVFSQLQKYRINMIIDSTKISSKFKVGLANRAKRFVFAE